MIFEAIKAPELTQGAELLASGSKGAAAENRGTDEKAIAAIAKEALVEVVRPLVNKVIESPTFISYAKAHGLPL